MAKQKMGQNFLHDKNIADKIVASIPKGKNPLIEIGPGPGIITKRVSGLQTERKIIAIEKDEEQYRKLLENMPGNIDLLNADILKFAIKDYSPEETITVIGNIPYYISKEIIDWMIGEHRFISNGILMVQKEFFQKITAVPGAKIYNAQSVMFGYLFESKKLFDVKPGSFTPPPKVTSTVFTFSKRGQVHFPENLTGYYKFLKTAFLHRRKTLLNNLGKDYNKDKIKRFLKGNNLTENIRTEDIKSDELRNMYLSI